MHLLVHIVASESEAAQVSSTPTLCIRSWISLKCIPMSKYVPPQRRPKGNDPAQVMANARNTHSSTPEKYTPKPNVYVRPVEGDKLAARAWRFASSKAPESEDYGLISRGEDTRLQNSSKLRVEFFERVRAEFAKLCLKEAPSSVSDLESTSSAGLSESSSAPASGSSNAISYAISPVSADGNVKSMDWVLMSLRKLREALIHLETLDSFSVGVFLFSVRVSINVGHYQTYVPSINFLMKRYQDDRSVLTEMEFYEVTKYLILHYVHSTHDFMAALNVYTQHSKKDNLLRRDVALRRIMDSYFTDDYDSWFRGLASESDVNNYRLMRMGFDRMLTHFVLVVTKAYFTIPMAELVKMLHDTIAWRALMEFIKDRSGLSLVGVHWRVHGSNPELVTIKDRPLVKK
ncbi:hypothetical protein BABINDRAFT_161978 [Babjeviella inositovora NRRL Y-12698]|uniref:Uncharacterized protein n=1 Tax=Babjeviella inositovora NRRL Y-12698 TaxID=984486 RepID=A0A1E3QPF8_9ASCO|nr:uncharacterized protein BABINDRAFT_161978 [Babjeviella inositovora NRRL Y-12698]ODQ79596.1 hypothetical protein BABINDRAFT_161978 [Babjeviella inositovora NRRL Y-12698]